MATDHGLSKYNGYEFEVFYHEESDSTSISSNIVRSIEEDDDGNLWIGTFNGLNLFHRETKTFSHFESLPNTQINRLDLHYMQLDDNGKLWFNFLNSVGWFDIHNRLFQFDASISNVSSMAVAPYGDVWMTTGNGNFTKYDFKKQAFASLDKSPKHLKEHVYFGEYSKKLWVTNTFSKKEDVTKTVRLPDLPNVSALQTFREVDATTLWIGTDKGLYIFDREKNETIPVDFGNNASTLSQSIKSIYQDRDGGIWVGTLNGVFYFDKNQKQFINHKIAVNVGDVIMGMGTYKNEVLVNRLGEGLYRYDSIKNTFKKLAFNPKKEVNYIWDIQEVPSSDYPVWMATNESLILYQPVSGLWKKIDLPSGENIPSTSFAIQPYQDEKIWVTSTKGIHLLREKDGQILKTIALEKQAILSSVQDIHVFKDKLFIGSEGEGVFVYDITKNKLTELSELVPDASQMNTASVWDLYATANQLWMGTNQGLYSLNLSDWTFRKIATETSLSKRIIFSIMADSDGQLWMGTESGLVSYDPKSDKVANYGVQDGIENLEFNRRAVIKVQEQLWFGGVQNITAFNPEQITQNAKVPPVYLTEVNVITPDSTFTPSFKKDTSLKLPWYHNTLEFSFVALNYTNPLENQYKYQLTDYDPDWIYDKKNRTARYVQLPPGTYNFKVLGANNDGIWNPEPEKLTVIITPPYWKTIWFRALVGLVVLLLLWLAYRYRVRKLLEVERIKLRIAGDLHDEIGSGLSGIALTGDVLEKQLKQGETAPELVSRITKNARTLASLLDAIVWLIDPHKETLEDLIAKSRTVAQELLPHAEVQIKQKLGETQLQRNLSSDQKRNLFLFIKESIHNVSKHASADRVMLNFNVEKGDFIFSIEDNGKGFNPKQLDQGHGLSSMKKRAANLDAKYSVRTNSGEGTLICLSLKLP